MIDLIPHYLRTLFLRKELQIYKNAQNRYFYVKIGLWILTTNFAIITFHITILGGLTYVY